MGKPKNYLSGKWIVTEVSVASYLVLSDTVWYWASSSVLLFLVRKWGTPRPARPCVQKGVRCLKDAHKLPLRQPDEGFDWSGSQFLRRGTAGDLKWDN